jgi:hypothetical protein
MRQLDELERAADPDDATVGEAIAQAIRPTYA